MDIAQQLKTKTSIPSRLSTHRILYIVGRFVSVSSVCHFTVNSYRACRYPYALCRVRFSENLLCVRVFYNTHSWTPTAEELKYFIEHLRAQAQLNDNYASEERCLAAVLEANRQYPE